MDTYSIEIDAELYTYLKQHIDDFEDTPNSVIKRLLGLSSARSYTSPIQDQETRPTKKTGLKRRRQTSLSELVGNGDLRPDEELILKINGKEVCKGTIDGDLILWNNERYSMSGLAVKFLQQEGYNTKHARGPAFWFTEKNKSIKELWDAFLGLKEFLGD